MRLAARLWVLGGLLPSAALLVAVLAGGRFLAAQLEGTIDQALLSQAAIQAVSLFDGPGGAAHFHLQGSPLGEQVHHVAPAGSLYDADGRPVIRYPSDQPPGVTPERLRPSEVRLVPVMATRQAPQGGRLRTLTVALDDPLGRHYALQLAASLGQADAAVAAFERVGLLMTVALVAGLVALQSILARRLFRRVRRLSVHMAALREGDLAAVPPADPSRDEIGELSRVVAGATDRLRLARAAQERLIADAAHELRTPLTLMRTSLDLSLRRRRAPEEIEATLLGVRDEVDRLARLSARLLDLAAARRGAWDRAPGDLAEVALDAVDAARPAAEARGVLVTLEAPAPATASFDAHGLRQAIDNLLANAVRHSPDGGTVAVAVAVRPGAVRLTVHDDGPGIPAEHRERIFEPFERGVGGGAGLGLAIVRDVVRGHGGRVWVDGAVPGATLALELPTA